MNNEVARFKWSTFKVLARIGKGSFGEIWLGNYVEHVDETRARTIRAAVKFEKRGERKHYWLLKEAKLLEKLKKKDVKNVGLIYHHCVENGFNVMVMKLYGDSLLDIKSRFKRFSLKTVLMIGIRLISILENIHKQGIIHCDIKPSNLLLHHQNEKDFSLIDFGLAKEYIKKGVHIKYKQKSKNNKSITGTALFCSLNTHRGNLSRRDDIESILYLMIYFLNGRLPWQGIIADNKYEKYHQIFLTKSRYKNKVCNGLDIEFKQYYNYCRKLKFTDEPDYEYLRNLLRYLMIKKKYKFDFCFDWVDDNMSDSKKSDEEKPIYYRNEKPSGFWSWMFGM